MWDRMGCQVLNLKTSHPTQTCGTVRGAKCQRHHVSHRHVGLYGVPSVKDITAPHRHVGPYGVPSVKDITSPTDMWDRMGRQVSKTSCPSQTCGTVWGTKCQRHDGPHNMWDCIGRQVSKTSRPPQTCGTVWGAKCQRHHGPHSHVGPFGAPSVKDIVALTAMYKTHGTIWDTECQRHHIGY